MKKNVKMISLGLVCLLIVVFGSTAAFAQNAKAYLNFYPTGSRTVNVNTKDYFQVLTSAAEPPTVKVSDETRLKVEFDKQVGDATLKTYQYRYEGLKAGSVTVTVASKDNMTVKETFTVKESVSPSTSENIVIKSDTTGDFSIKQGRSYTFKITCTAKNGVSVKPIFTVGNNSVLKSEFVRRDGNNFYYKVTATGKVGQESGVYTAVSGKKPVRQSKIIITSATGNTTAGTGSKKQTPSVKCDTSGEFGIAKGAKYCFKITASKGNVPTFTFGTKNVFTSKLIKKSGNDYFYEITAIGKPGQSAGVYTTLPGQKPVKQCKVLIARG